MKKNSQMMFLRFTIAVSIIGFFMTLMGCKGACPIITRFETEPQWICPGKDFSPKVHFRIENFDEEGNHSTKGEVLKKLLDTTKANINTPGLVCVKPGVVLLTHKLGPMNQPSPGIIETPANGVTVVSGSKAQTYRFALVASNVKCKDKGEKHLLSIQNEIESHYGVDLDDDEIMTAHTAVELIAVGAPKRLCVPHVKDVSGGWYWVKEEVRAGKSIVIDFVENTNDFPINVMPPGQPSKILSSAGQHGARTHDFDGHSPNGKWKIKAPNNLDYEKYIKHSYKYLGKPSICITVGIKCQ